MHGDEQYVWQAREQGGWSTIMTYIPFLGEGGPLTARKLEVAEAMESIAKEHGKQLGQEVRLARFVATEVLRTHTPTRRG